MTSPEVSPDSDPPVSDDSRPVEAPVEAPIELDRMRRNVRAQLFGGTAEPTRIGRFRLLQCIGRGGMGVVWSAHDDKLDRTVAIKLLRPEVAGHDLTAEARALARLSHPNVVSVFDVGEHEGQRFIAMEFVQGDTLREWLLQPRSVADVVDVFLAAGQGLSAAHAVGLVHRDFKPDNVLVGDDGRPRVLDFGLARRPDLGGGEPPVLPSDANPFATTMTQAGLLLGTPAYMAPEQHLGDPADARSDQFAFAVALFEGLTGVLPFQGGDLRALSLSIVAGRIHKPPAGTLSPQLHNALGRALSQDPAARFPDIDAMLLALRGALASSDVSFNTREVDQVLARAAELQAAAPSRPGLSAAELEAVAVE
ncbi:MAG: serine/threonine protein kinase, partial [Nannocystaceae bacterium]|nr:serine/threonine protein kinase [Nannocystaceae bacterium]